MRSIRQILLGSMALLCLATCVEDNRKGGKQPHENQRPSPPSPPPSPPLTPYPSPITDDDDDDDDDDEINEDQDDEEVEVKEIAVHATFLRSEQGQYKVVMALLAASEQKTLPTATELKVLRARLTNFHVIPDKVATLSEDGTEFSTALDIEAKLSVGDTFYCVKGKLEKTKDTILTESLGDGNTAASLRSKLKSLETTQTIATDGCKL